jgi:hypothetical protein
MNSIQKMAYKSWKDQRQRCSNPKDPRFIHSGAKGIKVEYSAREFIFWYSKEILTVPNEWFDTRIHVGRKDHNKNYCFDNIQLESISQSVKERNQRKKNPFTYCPRDENGRCVKIIK